MYRDTERTPAQQPGVNYLPYSILGGVFIERPAVCRAAGQAPREAAHGGGFGWLGGLATWWQGHALRAQRAPQG